MRQVVTYWIADTLEEEQEEQASDTAVASRKSNAETERAARDAISAEHESRIEPLEQDDSYKSGCFRLLLRAETGKHQEKRTSRQ